MKVVVVCSPEDSITHVMKLMTQRRVRHLPVKEGDQLVGIISIGDVLKHRLDEVELEANVLRDYAVAARRCIFNNIVLVKLCASRSLPLPSGQFLTSATIISSARQHSALLQA